MGDAEGSEFFASATSASFPGVGFSHGSDLCQRCADSPLTIERIRSVFYFDGAIRQAIHHLKYQKRAVLAEPLGRLMAAYWGQSAASIDVVVPVPLHESRRRQRGYNQAALLANAMARHIGVAVDDRTLVRNRATASQVQLNAQQRMENVKQAFTCVDGGLRNRRVLLIDDVCTTGATLDACAQALYAQDVQHVEALTLARAL